MTSSEDLYSSIKDNVERARALAVTLGEVIGKVVRGLPSKVTSDEMTVNVLVPPDVYYKHKSLGRVGTLLGVVDIKTLYFVLLRAVGYERADAASVLYSDTSLVNTAETYEDEPGGLMTNVLIKCEMLTKYDVFNGGPVEAADIVVEPQSPVIIPRGEVIEKALDLNRGLLRLGYLDSSQEVRVSASFEDMNYHTLIVGTTGTGKTSFIKNLIATAYLLDEKSRIYVLDTTGDYYHIFLPPDFSSPIARESFKAFTKLVGKVNGLKADIVFPVTRTWLKYYANGNKDVASITAAYYNNYVRPILEYLEKKGLKLYVSVTGNSIRVSNSEWTAEARILPFYFKFSAVKGLLHKLNPYFSEQASHFLKILIRKYKDEVRDFEDLVEILEGDVSEQLKIHKSTKENIIRGLYLLENTGLFNVGSDRVRVKDVLDSDLRLTIFDFYNSNLDDFAQKIMIYYVLDKIFEFREKQLKAGSLDSRALIIIDEAHKFFPSAKGSEEDTNYVRRVAGKIALMMRLGRRRRLGFVFATHNPNDLSDIIVQLANNKFLFRIKAEVAESFGLSKAEAMTLSREANGVAYYISPWLRESKIKIRVPIPPPVGHYDLSRS
ncbi:MAG: ATP-binding protein [Thermoprotei archaeon]